MTEQTPRTGLLLSQPKWLMVALSLSLALGGGAFAAPTTKTLKVPPATGTNEYILGPEDVLDITVSNHTDLNTSATVQPDGTITLPRAGEFTARGKSARRLAREIQSRLALTLNNARVQVLLKQARPRRARIIGAVKTAGTYDLKLSGSHIMDLVAQAGGLSTKATRISGRIVRSGNVIPFNLAKAVNQPDGASNLVLRPDDLVVLDAQDYAKQLTVTGSVKIPGAYDLDEGLTVAGLLAQAGGPLPDAALRKSQILRDGKPVLTDLSEAVEGNISPASPVAQFTFRPGDILLIAQNQQRFSVTGEVVKPNYYPLPEEKSDATVFKALSQAGGPLPDGDLSQATLTRTVDGRTQVIPVDVASIIAGKAPDSIELRPDDILYVPKKQDKHIGVYGMVAKPDTYILEDGMTLLDVLAKAGNPVSGAGLSRAYVLRDGQQIPFNLRPALVDHTITPDIATFRLQDNDSLYVPDTKDLVQVQGSVLHPGPYSLDDDLTVNSLLTKAGSATEIAATSKAYVERKGEKIYLNLTPSETGTLDPAVANFRFLPGDVLFVPENPLRFSVIGEVTKPGVFSYPENPSDATVLNVLTVAGGPSNGRSADLAKAGIVRNVNGQAQFIPVNLTKLFSAKRGESQADVQILPKDILYVPSKGTKTSPIQYLGALGALATIF